MIDWDGIRDEIKRRRAAAKLTQRDLAALMKVPHATVGRIETGTFKPSIDMLAMIAAVLGCTVRDLIIERPTTRRRLPKH